MEERRKLPVMYIFDTAGFESKFSMFPGKLEIQIDRSHALLKELLFFKHQIIYHCNKCTNYCFLNSFRPSDEPN